jgi:MYXO-CTERM domain-containing protein
VGLVGGDASAAIVGPDTFGYRAVDQADGAVYDYIDISVPLNQVLVNADDSLVDVVLGAPFTFYGNVLTAMAAGSNGFLAETSILDNQPDAGNDCPIPFPAAGGGARIAVLHDDLVTSVYYRYFDEAQAAAVGYPGQAAGISVFQWEGVYFFDDEEVVDAEAILFHGDGRILTMVATAGQNGSNSTTGIQNTAATIGLNYACDNPGTITPGTTAVLFAPPPVVSINEIRLEQTSTDNDEYFELVGPPGASLDGLTYVVLGDTNNVGALTGTIEAIASLDGEVIPPSGYFVVAEATFTLGEEDLVAPLNFENNDTVTHMLVRSFTGADDQTLDTGSDGTLDTQPWFSVNDAVSVIAEGSTELVYAPGGACSAGVYCNSVTPAGPPDHVFRCGDGTGVWNDGALNPALVPGTDSPGEPNPCACGDGLLIIGEVCDAGGEAAMCDDDCTLPLCGDSNANQTAGETCDTGGNSATCDVDCTAIACNDGVFNPQGETCDEFGETATCDDDCTAVQCGDGNLNEAAAEVCDTSGESMTCDDDCTLPSCGDGNVNEAAGETCDTSGESATCDDDCTAVACGDDNINETAGETCDDGGRSATCNANCTAASCGDGIFNAASGEECDGDGAGTPGETATCDTDCTNAMCGDMVVNALAAETCDAGAEADDCDDDCTVVACGDGNVNEAAGEECDDGNTEDDDGCSADCTEELGPGTSSGSEESSSGGESEGSSTTDDPTSGTSDTGDTSVTDPDSSGTAPDTSGSASMTDSDTNDEETDSDSDDDSSSGGSGNVTPDDDGCGCSTTDNNDLTASLLAFFGLGALRRRRRRS